MAEATDAEHRNKVARFRGRVAQRAHEVAVAARPTVPAAAAEKSYADALADFPALHTRADRVDVPTAS